MNPQSNPKMDFDHPPGGSGADAIRRRRIAFGELLVGLQAVAARRLLAALIASAVAAVGCAPSTAPIGRGLPTGYDRLEEGVAVDGAQEAFEQAHPEIAIEDVVPPELVRGPHHVLRSVRLDHRFLYTYVIDSDRGPLEVVGRGLLRKRVLELEALGDRRPSWLGGTRLYGLEVVNAVAQPVEGVLQILRHPVRTATNVPRGLAASFRAFREMAQMGRTHVEDDYYEEFIGLSSTKREWAGRWGIDPYSTNPYVQDHLSRNGWVSLAGRGTVGLARLAIPGGAATIALTVVGATSGMSEQLRDVAPEDIRVTTRAFLSKELAVEPELAERFLEHPWYSPTRQDMIIRALTSMEGTEHRDRFIEMAARADEPHEAYGFTRLALMLAECHRRRAPLSEIFIERDLVMARTREGEQVLPLYMDLGLWTAELARAEDDLRSALAPKDAPRLLLVSGHFSGRAAAELDDRGWQRIEGLEDLWLMEHDRLRFRPLGRDEDRILPKLGR